MAFSPHSFLVSSMLNIIGCGLKKLLVAMFLLIVMFTSDCFLRGLSITALKVKDRLGARAAGSRITRSGGPAFVAR